MITYGGERVSLDAGTPSVRTIGVSLGRIARFCGHTELYYTVLAHSAVVAAILPPRWGIYGLMHDSQETLVSDVPTPMKSQVARNREQKLQERIYIANGLMWPLSTEIIEAVEEADHAALIAEANVLRHIGCIEQWGTDFDPEAGRLTRKYQKKVIDWLDPAKSGPFFERKFKHYAKLAGLNEPGIWA